jgi:MFS family permease
VSARWAITAVFALNGALIGAWAARIPAIKDRLDLSDGQLAVVVGALAVGAIVAMPLAGGWAARVGSRRATRLAAVTFVLVAPLVALAPGFGWLVVAALGFGVANGSLDVAMNAHGVAVERRAGRPLLAGFHAAFSLGGLAGAASGALAAGAGVDPRVNLPVLGLVCALVLAPAWRGLGGVESRDARGVLVARPSGPLWVLGGIAFCSLLAEGAAADWSAVYVARDLGASEALAGAAYACFSLTMAVGRLVGDRLVSAAGPVVVVRAGTLLAAAGLGCALVVGRPGAALAGFALLGGGLACVVPVVFRAAGTLPGHPSAASIAAVSTLGYAGFLAGPPIVGVLAEVVSLPVGLAAVAVLLAGVSFAGGRVEPRPA